MTAQRIEAGRFSVEDDFTHGVAILSKIRVAASKALCLVVGQ
jgi:hypothetical protein